MRLRILGQWVDVVESDPGDWSVDGMGRSNEIDGRLLLRAGLSPGARLNTLLHEIVHLVLGVQGQPRAADNEAVVSAIATGMLTLLVDNPQLAPWIAAARRNGRTVFPKKTLTTTTARGKEKTWDKRRRREAGENKDTPKEKT